MLGNKHKRGQAIQYVKTSVPWLTFLKGSCRGGDIITVERKSGGDDETAEWLNN